MNLEFPRQIFEKYTNIKFHETPSSGSRVVPCGRTDGQKDMTKLIVAFRNFAKSAQRVKTFPQRKRQISNEDKLPRIKLTKFREHASNSNHDPYPEALLSCFQKEAQLLLLIMHMCVFGSQCIISAP